MRIHASKIRQSRGRSRHFRCALRAALLISSLAAGAAHAETGLSSLEAQPILTLSGIDDSYQAAGFAYSTATSDDGAAPSEWRANEGPVFRGGFSNRAQWLRFRLHNDAQAKTWVLSLNNNRLDNADLYILNPSDFDANAPLVPPSATGSAPGPALRSGDLRKVSERDLPTPYPAFRFHIPPGESRSILLRVQSTSLLAFHVLVETPERFADRRSRELSIQAVYAAFGLLYLILPPIIAMVLRRPLILAISVLAWSVLMVGFVQAGDANVLLWPESPEYSWPALLSAACLFFFSSAEFTRRVLQLPAFQPRLNRVFLFVELCVALIWVFGLVRQPPAYLIGVSLFAIAHIALLLFAQLRALRYGRLHVWFMLLGTALIGGGMIVRHLTVLGVFEYHPVLQNAGVLLYPIDLIAWTLAFVFWSRKLELERTQNRPLHESRAHAKASSRARIRNLPVTDILAGVQRLVREEQIYRRPELSLSEMAGRLKIRPDQLSAILNLKLQTDFAGLINAARIEEACRLLRSEREQTILDIAFEVGFGSKAAFNRAFSKARGQTATAYRKSALADDG